ncbi:MAG: hypothetical protein WCP85_22965 [Mariniphaga sp.]
MKNEIYEIIKEYEVSVEGIKFKIKGKILKDLTDNQNIFYFGVLSHYCKPNEESSTVYYPSLTGQDFESAKHLLILYLESFTTIDVTKNDSY